MSIITILLFFIYMYGLGFSLTYFLKIKEQDRVEREVMRIGLGIPTFILLGVLLNLIKIPLHWWIFLILSLAGPLYTIIRKKKTHQEPKQKLCFTKKHLIYIFVLFLFLFNLYTYATGSFAYEYLEDDDPWTYARETKYVAAEKRLDVDYFRNPNHLDPYPPAFAMITGIMHQTSPDRQWTLKFFNSLIISLGFIFFFFMAMRLTKNSKVALAATFVLSMVPAYLSHFIWAHSLIPLLFFILIYCYERQFINKQYFFITAIAVSAILLTHPFQAMKLGVMTFIYLGVRWFYEKKFPTKLFTASILGVILSFSWWAFKAKRQLAMQTTGGAAAQQQVLEAGTTVSSLFSKAWSAFTGLFDPFAGSATRAYTFSDFFIATKSNMINSPIGWGIAISILLGLALVIILLRYKKLLQKRNSWIVIVALWFIFTFLGVNSETFNLPIGFGAFRMWMLLAIPLSLLVGWCIVVISSTFRKIKPLQFIVLLLLLTAIFSTAGYYKYYHNTNPGWPPGGRLSLEEHTGLVWMKQNLPLDSTVFTYTTKINKFVFGANMYACVWCESYRNFKAQPLLENDMARMHSLFKENNVEYLLFTARDLAFIKGEYYENNPEYDEQRIAAIFTNKANEAASMPDKYQMMYQANGFLLFKIL